MSRLELIEEQDPHRAAGASTPATDQNEVIFFNGGFVENRRHRCRSSQSSGYLNADYQVFIGGQKDNADQRNPSGGRSECEVGSIERQNWTNPTET